MISKKKKKRFKIRLQWIGKIIIYKKSRGEKKKKKKAPLSYAISWVPKKR